MARINGPLIQAQIEWFATGSLPAAATYPFRAVWDTTTNEIKVSDGTNWRVVSTIDAIEQLTNKDIDGGTASNSKRITIPKDTLANLTALTRKQGTIVYATDSATFYVDDGSQLNIIPSGASVAGQSISSKLFNYLNNY